MKKILLIDDEPNSVLRFSKMLKQNQYEVTTASWGENGIERVKQEHPDLILLDVKMPEIDGFAALTHLKQTIFTKFIPVIMMTGYYDLDHDTIEMAKTLGAEGLFEKSEDFSTLLEKISDLLNDPQ